MGSQIQIFVTKIQDAWFRSVTPEKRRTIRLILKKKFNEIQQKYINLDELQVVTEVTLEPKTQETEPEPEPEPNTERIESDKE